MLQTLQVVEVRLSLLAQASMPLKFWDEDFRAAVYLINRTPIKVIQYETPLESLSYQTKLSVLESLWLCLLDKHEALQSTKIAI
jgi:hypothetical protein